ncbi:MAG TPA: polyprenyl synthetase family protein [Candidatus Bathyarchaeia archaeon]|nr:polyprenyl synthetase family protein [Candidatus Bathyarchaeia archaeon]
MSSEKNRASYSSDFQSYCSNAKKLVDFELQTLLPAIAKFKLRKQIEYALLTKGKRLRPTLVLLSGESAGGNRTQLRRLALAFELLHLATLVHDDVLDEDTFRRNALSVYAKWSVKDAILVGDVLASFSLSLCKGYRREILNVIIDTCMQLSDGEYSDVELAGEELNEKEYFGKIQKKCAALFRAACECGALAAGGSSSVTEALRLFGENYGVAYQIKDDILDAQEWGNDLQPDVNKFRATLPIIHAYETAGEEKQVRFRRLLSAKTTQSLSIFLREVQPYFEKGSLNYCTNRLNMYVERAVASLAPLKETRFKSYLVEMAELLKVEEREVGIQKIAAETKVT